MHEVSIASELIRVATLECNKNGYNKISSIKVAIGKATGVMPEALLFAFNVLKEGTAAESAILVIEEIPIKGFCEKCKKEFEGNNSYIVFQCPFCESFSVNVVSGKELNIIEMEVSDEN
ncbi:MAG: hydrogenase maturation nickel metallochaperone HypA [Thermodesulfovibrionaceae bacterium]